MNRDPHTSRLLSSSSRADTSLPHPGNTSHSFHFGHQAPVCAMRTMQKPLACFSPSYPSVLAGLSRIFEMFASVDLLMSKTVLWWAIWEAGFQQAKVDFGGFVSPSSDQLSFEL